MAAWEFVLMILLSLVAGGGVVGFLAWSRSYRIVRELMELLDVLTTDGERLKTRLKELEDELP